MQLVMKAIPGGVILSLGCTSQSCRNLGQIHFLFFTFPNISTIEVMHEESQMSQLWGILQVKIHRNVPLPLFEKVFADPSGLTPGSHEITVGSL